MLYVFIILSLYVVQIQNKANMEDNRPTLYIRGYFTDLTEIKQMSMIMLMCVLSNIIWKLRGSVYSSLNSQNI